MNVIIVFGSLIEVSTSYVLLRNKKNSLQVRSQYKRGIQFASFPII